MSRHGGKAPDDQTRLKKMLNELTKLEANKFCADCGCRGPRWASINLGVFICIQCSGIHRSLGVHLTFVRSVNLDSWTPEQVEQMKRWGNARAKEYYEANVPRDFRAPTEHSSVRDKEMWIRDKYERKRFIAHEPPAEHGDDRRQTRRKKHSDSDDDADEDEQAQEPRRRRSDRRRANGSRGDSRTSSREAVAAVKPAKPAVANDLLSFDAFSSPTPAPQAVAAPAAAPVIQPPPQQQAPAQDEWASFSGSSSSQSGFPASGADAFAPKPADQHSNRMASIMASFGPPAVPQQQQQQQHFPPQQGMAPPAPMGMGMGQQGFMNPMMGQQGFMNPMMYPMQGQMQGQMPQNGGMMPQNGGMMHGGGFQGGAGPMGFQGNPMAMQMNGMGFQQQQQHHHHQQQQQQRPQQSQVGGLNQSFVHFG